MSEFTNDQRYPSTRPSGVYDSHESETDGRDASAERAGGNGSRRQSGNGQPAGRLQKQASKVLGDVRRSARNMLNHEKDSIAVQVEDYGRAIKRAADTLGESGETAAASRTSLVAQQIEGVADYLERTDILALRDDIRDAANSRPGLFLAGMFFSGMAAAQLLRSSSRSSQSSSSRTEDSEQSFDDQA